LQKELERLRAVAVGAVLIDVVEDKEKPGDEEKSDELVQAEGDDGEVKAEEDVQGEVVEIDEEKSEEVKEVEEAEDSAMKVMEA
jgi:hypothetical protein